MKFLLILFFNLILVCAKAQYPFAGNHLTEEDRQNLRREFGQGKQIPPEFEAQCLIALSYYPELTDKKIDFVYADIGFTMSCKPYNRSFFQRGRHYKISIDNDSNGYGVILDSVPLVAQVGVIGHELAHVVDYERGSKLRIMGIGLKYLCKGKRGKIEKRVDRITIDHGLGWQLYAWAEFVMYGDLASEEYKNYKMKTYLKPEEIKALIKE